MARAHTRRLKGRCRVEILIESNLKLVSDANGWSLRSYRPLIKGPRVGTLDWAEDGHYDTLQWALIGAHKRLLSMGKGVADLGQLARRIEETDRKLLSLASQAMEVQLGGPLPGYAEENPWQPEAPPPPRRTRSSQQIVAQNGRKP